MGIEVTMRNVNLALLLKALLFPAAKGKDPIGDTVLFVVLYYAAVAMVAAIPLTLNHRRILRRIRAAEAAAAAETGLAFGKSGQEPCAEPLPGEVSS
jgi:hypothetical protein